MLRPTFRNLTESYEGWAYRNGLLQQIRKLEQARLLERDVRVPNDRIYRLTWQGRLHALGGRDPDTCWRRSWDGRWRLVLFDIPIRQNAHRNRVRRYLRENGFGCLQDSVWVTPDPLEAEGQVLNGGTMNVKSLILMEGRPCSGESDGDIVTAAWNFPRINQGYARDLKILEEYSARSLDKEGGRMFLRWAEAERRSWLAAVSADPLLPMPLLPRGYLGQEVWQRRVDVLKEVGARLRTWSASQAVGPAR